MSYDLEIYCAEPLTPERLADVIAGVDGLRTGIATEGPGAAHEIERTVRGKIAHVATLDGPLPVELEDLPDAVRAAAVGVTTLYQLNCPWSPAVLLRLANRVARDIAEASRGVVFDPQEGQVAWPRGGMRKFTASREALIDVVDLKWYIRREDRTDALPDVVFDTIQSILPEALPRRFGGYEPLPFKLAAEGREGFAREWRAESLGLFWKTTGPCLAGSMMGLGVPPLGPRPPRHAVGSVELSFHRTALSDERWRHDVIRLFVTMVGRTRAFFALSDVQRSVGHSRGSLWYSAGTESPPGLVVRAEWLGLPSHAFWLAWLGPHYVDLVGDDLSRRVRVERVAGGLLLRTGEEPPERPATPETKPRRRHGKLFGLLDSRSEEEAGESPGPTGSRSVFPSELTMRLSPGEGPTPDRARADKVPDGL